MAFLARRLGRKALSAAPVAENFRSTVGVWFRLLRSFVAESGEPVSDQTTILKQRSVGVFWDLDNKPPKNVSPFKAATRLLEMAAGFGNVVDAVAYANHHAFSHVPTWVQEERKHRKMLDELEVRGLVKPEEIYVCGVCGAKKKTRVELTKHFKSLHEREQKKRLNRLESLRGKKKQKERFWDNNAEKLSKYKDAARSLILPKVGYGLMQDLRQAGLYVRTVEDKPEAADIALKEHITKSIKKGVRCICLVSDDSDFTPELKMARERNLHTIVVGDLRILSAYADTYFSWAEVASGIAEQKAKRETRLLLADFMNRVGDKLECHRYKGFGFDEDDIDEEENESDSDADVEDGKHWRPPERTVRPDSEHQDFDLFSDDSSESDSDEENDKAYQKSRNLRSCVAHRQFGIYARSRCRGFSTERNVDDSEVTSFNDMISETDLRASLPKGSRGAPSKIKGLSKTASSTPAASVEANSESVDEILQSLFDSSSAFEKRRGLESDRKDSTGLGDIEPDAEGSCGSGASSNVRRAGHARTKKKMSFDEGDLDKQKRTKSKKPTNHYGGKSSEPVPFYMSGFASEAKEDCDRINNWYLDFWKNDDEEYRGRRVFEHKKKKKNT